MPLDDLPDRLAKMQGAFNDAPADSSGPFDLPPDGDYQALVRRFDFFEAKASGQAFLKTELEVANHPEHAGRSAETVHNLEDPAKIEYLKRHLATLGADVEQLDLREVRPGSPTLEALCDTPVEITIKTSDKTDRDGNPYRNVYVNKRLGDPLRSDVPMDTTPSLPTVPADEPIPF
jgi:hypothetical protein